MTKGLPHIFAGVLVSLLCVAGCTNSHAPKATDYETVAQYPTRNRSLAQQENALAVQLLADGDYEAAEKKIKNALTADVTYGPAHNNLGKVYYHQGRFYQAAWEFRYAIKLMPHQPEPINNLGLVFEAVGQLDSAVTQYDQARQLQPDNPQIIGNLARARYRNGDRSPELREILTDLIARDTRPAWVAWAREKLALLPSAKPSHEPAPADPNQQ